MRPRVLAAGVIFGGGLLAPAPNAAAQIGVGGPDEAVELNVDVSPEEQRVKVKARADLGDVEVGTIQADVKPRIGQEGDEPAATQDSGNDPQQPNSDGDTQIAPANIYAHPRVFSPGSDGDVEQRNPAESQIAPVNADVSPRVFSDGDSGNRTQRNGSEEAEPGPAPSQEQPPPDDGQGGGIPLLGPVGRRGSIDLAAVNADISPRIVSAGSDGNRSQRNGYDGAGNGGDETGNDNQIVAVNAAVAPDVLSDGNDGSVEQWNGTDDDQAVSATGDDAVTGGGDQVLTDNQVLPVNALIATDILSNGDDGSVSQHNGSQDGQQATAENGDAITGGGDQFLTDDQVAPLNAVVAGDIGSAGNTGAVDQHNGSDDDEYASVVNGVGSDGDAQTGGGDETLTDLQALPVNLLLAPDLGAEGSDGPVTQHNGSDDDEEAHVTNAGQAGGDASTGSGDEALTDLQVVPVTAALAPSLGSAGDDGAITQHNGSDDDQLVTVTNGVGADGNGTAGAGDQTIVDLQAVPAAVALSPDLGGEGADGATTQHNGSDDDQEVHVTNAGECGGGGDGATGGGDQVLVDAQAVPVTGAVSPDVGHTGNDGGTTQHNGSDDDQLVTVTNGIGANGDGTTGGGDQTLVDPQAVPVSAVVSPDVGGTGDDGPTFQHNGSDDDQEVHITNAGQTGGDGTTGGGDQVVVDVQAVPVTGAVSPDLGQTGNDGGTTQHNGSDDDQLVTVTNGVGADGDGTTGGGDQTLVDPQVVPAAAVVSPDAGGEGTDGPTSQHNGSDDDQEVHITNAGEAGGDGNTGGGGQVLTDPQVVPSTTAVPGGGEPTQQNGSDDDQLVIVTNGPGSDGTGTAGNGPQEGSDVAILPLGLLDPNRAAGTSDDVKVIVRGSRVSGGQPTVQAERRRSDIERRRSERRERRRQTSTTAGPAAPRIEVKSDHASGGELPRTGGAPLPLAALGLLTGALGLAGRRRTREKTHH